MIYRIKNPESSEYEKLNTLTAATPQGAITLKVFENRPLRDRSYILLGEPYQMGTELILPRESANNVITLDAATQQDHLQSTPIYYTRLKFVNVYVSLDGGTTESVITTIPIDWARPYTDFFDKSSKDYSSKPTYRYAFADINNTITDKITLQDGDRAGIISYREGVTGPDLEKQFKMATFGDAYSDKLDSSVIYMLLNKSLSDFAYIVAETDRHYFDRLYTVSLIKDVTLYPAPYDVILPSDIRMNGCTLSKINPDILPQECKRTCESVSCTPPVAANPCCPTPETHVDEPCPDNCCEDELYFYYFVDNMIGIYPAPRGDEILQMRYSGSPAALNELTTTNPLPLGFDMSLIIGAQYYYYATQQHTAEAIQEYQKVSQMFREEKRKLEDHMRNRHRARKAERPETIRGRQAYPLTVNSGYNGFNYNKIYN